MSTWESRDLPVLQTIVEAERNGVNLSEISYSHFSKLELSEKDIDLSVDALDDKYIKANVIKALGVGVVRWIVLKVLPEGREAAGQWPSRDEEMLHRLLAAIDAQMESESDPKKKKSLEIIKDHAISLGSNVISELVVSAGLRLVGM